jgi:P pilus assembly chaperone PapD
MMTSHFVFSHRLVSRFVAMSIIGVAGVSAMPGAARAQFAIDKTEMLLTPGDSARRTGVVTVRNDGATRAQATVSIEDWDRAEDGGNRFFTAGTMTQSCAKAMKVFPLALNLAPGESQAVRITMDSSATAASAECWSVVLVETTLPDVNASGRTLLYRLRTGVKVYAMPRGLTLDGQVAEVAMHPGTAPDSTGQIKDTVEVAFQNTGTKHVVARGKVEIRRPDNTTVAVVELPLAYALPGATMRVRTAIPSLNAGRYVVLAVMDFGGAEIAAAQLEHEVR